MVSNQVLSNCLEEAKSISKSEFQLLDSLGIVVAYTDEFAQLKKDVILSFVNSEAETQEINGYLLIINNVSI